MRVTSVKTLPAMATRMPPMTPNRVLAPPEDAALVPDPSPEEDDGGLDTSETWNGVPAFGGVPGIATDSVCCEKDCTPTLSIASRPIE